MKTRFLTALMHERPGSDFESAVARNRIHRPLRIFAAARLASRPGRHRLAPSPSIGSQSGCAASSGWWRFASAWRWKSTDNFITPAGRKKMFHHVTGSLAVVALLLFAGCKTDQPTANYSEPSSVSALKPSNPDMVTVTNQLDPALLRTPTNLFTLGPGDKLDIELVDETNSLSTTVVGPDGKIYFNLLPGLDVWGLTLGQTRRMLEHEMTKYERGQPQVNVTLRDVQSKRVWLLGRFQEPGVYNMAAPTTLLEAIAAAGGSQSFAGQRQISQGGPLGADLADLRHSFIVRHNKMLPVDFHALLDEGDLSQNIYLQPDDFIYFAPAYAKEVYVLGAVTQPQPVQYVEGMTLMQAIAGSYGIVRDAYLAHITIVRGSLSHPQVAFANYYDIVKGRTPDVVLEPNDIVYVPLTRYRYLRKYLDIALNTFVSSVAINEGTKISTPANNGIAGVTIPVGSGITIIPPPAPPIQ
jgi:protein involved in polysaccharide export with SLBB domain